MTTYDVTISMLQRYRVEALDRESAEHAALSASYGQLDFPSATIPEFLDSEVVRVFAEKADLRMAVQVTFHESNTSRAYAFAVPEGLSVRIGDDVLVYSHIRNRNETAKVVDVGRGDYTGPLSEIIAKVEYPEPAEKCVACGREHDSREHITMDHQPWSDDWGDH